MYLLSAGSRGESEIWIVDMHEDLRNKIKSALVFLLFLLLCCLNLTPVQADDGPHRVKAIEVEYTERYWWMVRDSDNHVECELAIEHQDIPTPEEIYYQCGFDVYENRMEEIACEQENPDQLSSCSGFYFQHVGEGQKTRVIDIEIPPATIQIVPPRCTSLSDESCEAIPRLQFTSTEPLPNEQIILVEGMLDGYPFFCQGDSCEVQLKETDQLGVEIEFKADSSFGDSTIQHSGRIRVIQVDEGWAVDFLITTDESAPSQGCSQIWLAFPPPGDPPAWLANPDQAELLETNLPLHFLAGKLIQLGYVDASGCDYYGLTEDGYATQCGLELARDDVFYWQNNFDPFIIEAAQESGIPSRLIKRIISQESQFWPGIIEHSYFEHGLGQLTFNGVDATLMWNEDFYDAFCPLVLLESACERGYAHLGKLEQEMLQNVYLNNMAIDLPSEPGGFDQEQIRTSLAYLGEAVIGNCRQVGKMVENLTGDSAGLATGFEDLWRFTLANYHAGPGCLSEALGEVHAREKPLTWVNISMELEEVCPHAVDYVIEVTK